MKSNRQYTRPQTKQFYDEVPIGQEVDLLLDEDNPNIPDGYVLMEGQTVSDSESPLNGQTLPNRNVPKVKEIDSNYTIQDYDAEIFYADASGGDITLTLPSLSNNLGKRITIRASVNAQNYNGLSISPASGEKIASLSIDTSITLTKETDFWTLEAGLNRWELIEGWERIIGSNLGRKYADGKMEQWGHITVTGGVSREHSASVTFQKEFLNDPKVMVSGSRFLNNFVSGTNNVEPITTGFDAYIAHLDSGDNASSSTVQWFAVGFWYTAPSFT